MLKRGQCSLFGILRGITSVASVLTMAFVMALIAGCSSDSKNSHATTNAVDSNAVNNNNPPANGEKPIEIPKPGPKPLFDGWNEPALVIVLSGEQHGYIEPCGCTENQLGGIARRADLFQKIKERNWPVTAFDLGGSIKRNRKQTEFKFEANLQALKEMGYEAIAMGPEELRLDAAFLLAKHSLEPDNPDSPPTFLAANVVLFNSPDLGTPTPTKVVTIGDIKIGVTAILGEGYGKNLYPAGAKADVTVRGPQEVLPSTIKTLKKEKPDLLVLLSQASLAESRELAKAFPDFDLVISAGGPEDGRTQPEQIGKSLLLLVGQKGKHVGVVGYFPNDPKTRLRFELVAIDQDRFEEVPAMVEHMRTYQDNLREFFGSIIKALPQATHPGGSKFVGAEKCGECHTTAYEKWEETKHFHAYESLKKPREGAKDWGITRIYDPECLACHVAGWHSQRVFRYGSGFINEAKSPLLKGVQCENCHGPGSRHIQLAEQDDLKLAGKEMRVTLEQAKDKLCYSCHDLDNSPNFEFKEYWKKIEHPGLE